MPNPIQSAANFVDYLTNGDLANAAPNIAFYVGQVTDIFPVAPTGGDDTANISQAITRAQASAGTVVLAAGAYNISSTITPGTLGPFSLTGQGPATILRATAAFTGTWLMDLTFTVGSPDVTISDLLFDMHLSPTLNGLRLGNTTGPTDGLLLQRVKFRYGAYALALDGGCTTFTVRDVRIQNSTAGMHITNSQSTSNPNGLIDNLQVINTDNTVATTQGLLVDTFMTGLVLNAVQVKGTASSVFSNGIVVNCTSPTGTNGSFVQSTNCVTDGITGPGLSLTNCRQWQSSNDFWSCLVSTNNYGVSIVGGSYFHFDNCEISGNGVNYASAPDDISFINCNFPATGSTAGLHTMPGSNPPTNLQFDMASINYSSHATAPQITNNLATFYTALTDPKSIRFVEERLSTAGPVAENFEFNKVNTNSTNFTLGDIYVLRLWLPRGFPVNTLYWCCGATPFTAGTTTHYWMALYAYVSGLASGAPLVQSTDNTGPTIGASTVQAVSMASTYVIPTTGYYGTALFLSSTGGSPTAPSVMNFAGISAATNLNPKACYIQQTGFASGTAPSMSGSSAALGNEFWVGAG